MQKWREWQTASESDWGVAVQREAVIRPLAEQAQLTGAAVTQAADQLRTSRASVYRLVGRYKQRPQTSSLLPWKRGRGSNVTVLNSDREQLLNSCIKEFYLLRERPSLAALIQEVKRRFFERELLAPNYRTIRRRVEALDVSVVIRKREGSKRAREMLGPVRFSSLRPELPLEVLQIDHTPVDVIVVDQEHRLPIGRPCLTLAIDVATRMVAGFHVSLYAPSAVAVSLVLSHAVLPKAQWLADRELQTVDWIAEGLPRMVHVDNAKEFHSEALIRGCQEYGIQLEHRPRGRPQYGGHIERLIGTMMGAVHLLPGTTFSDVREKGSYDSEGRAVLTLPELERWLALQIAGVYHLSVHSALGVTPRAAWQEAVARKKEPVRYPANGDEFFLDFLPAVPRRIQKDGIHFCKIRYWDNVLSSWAGRSKQTFLVKYDPRNLSRLYVRDSDGRHWPVPYADLRQPAIALWELEEARKRSGRNGRRAADSEAIFANILQQRQIVNEAVSHAKQRRRQEQTPLDFPVPRRTVAKLEETASGDVKAYPVEIWGELE